MRLDLPRSCIHKAIKYIFHGHDDLQFWSPDLKIRVIRLILAPKGFFWLSEKMSVTLLS